MLCPVASLRAIRIEDQSLPLNTDTPCSPSDWENRSAISAIPVVAKSHGTWRGMADRQARQRAEGGWIRGKQDDGGH
jgi:hypothetical protein